MNIHASEDTDCRPTEIALALPIKCNTSDEVLAANVRRNGESGIPIITAVAPHERDALIVGGGPSVAGDVEEIRARKENGAAVFAINGAALWLQSRGIVPDALIILDARAHNARFLSGLDRSVKCYLASQCDEAIIDAARDHEVILWHPCLGGISGFVEKRPTVYIGGGTSAGMRALRLAHVLGYRTLHLYGYDSSLSDGELHAYAQPENSSDELYQCSVAGRQFVSNRSMIRQADDFRLIAAGLIEEGTDIHVHGDGLLPEVARQMNEPVVDDGRCIHPTAQIHPKAHVGDDVKIGARTRIWQFASVIRGTVLGADCNVASSATLDGPHFGDRCIICQGVAMGPGFLFGNDVFVGPNVTICNDLWPSTSKANFDIRPMQRGEWVVIVKDGASIGANAVVLPGVTIGAGAVVAAGAVVSRSIPDDHLWKRSGDVVPLDRSRMQYRMIRA